MSTTEDRLIAALAARADQVHAEDLRAPEVPEVPATVTFLRRPAAYAVGIAAAAAAIAAPFVIGGLGSDDTSVPPSSEGPSPTIEPQTDVGGDWPVIDRQGVDLDGDGTPERVRLRSEPGEPLLGPRIRIESDLSGGGSLFGVTDSGGVGVNFIDPVDLDGDGAQELMLNRDQADGLSTDWVVVDVVGGQLVALEQAGSAPLSTGDVPDPDDPDMAFATDRWVSPDESSLFSSRSLRSFARYGMSFEVPDPYSAQVWSWEIDGLRLVPVAQDQLCISPVEETHEPCAGDEGEDVPAFFPEETNLIGVGESFTTDVDFDQVDDTVSLDGATPGVDGQVGDGDVELVVRTSTAGVKRLPIPAGGAPELYATTIQIGMLDGLSLVFRQETGDSSRFTYVATGSEGFSGDLLNVTTSGAPFGNGFLEDGSSYRTWVGADDRMYTGVEPVQDEPDRLKPTQVYVWTLEAGPELAAIALGGYCFDTVFGDVLPCD